MPLRPIAIRLGSLEKRFRPLRPFAETGPMGGRALDVQNVDIDRTNEVSRRAGYVRRLFGTPEGALRALFPFGGLCGRLPRYLDGGVLLFINDGIQIAPPQFDPITAEPLDDFGVERDGYGTGQWTYFGGLASPNNGCDGVKVLRRSDGAFPSDPNDGGAIIAYEGDLDNVVDTELGDGLIHYYRAYAFYPSSGWSSESDVYLDHWKDTFTRADGNLDHVSHSWIKMQAGVGWAIAGQLATYGGTTLQQMYTPDIQVEGLTTVTVKVKVVHDDALDGGAHFYQVGLHDLDGDRIVYAQLRLRTDGAAFWELTLYNGDVHTGAQNLVKPGNNQYLSLRLAGGVLTAAYAGDTIARAWTPWAGAENIHGYFGGQALAATTIKADEFAIQAV